MDSNKLERYEKALKEIAAQGDYVIVKDNDTNIVLAQPREKEYLAQIARQALADNGIDYLQEREA